MQTRHRYTWPNDFFIALSLVAYAFFVTVFFYLVYDHIEEVIHESLYRYLLAVLLASLVVYAFWLAASGRYQWLSLLVAVLLFSATAFQMAVPHTDEIVFWTKYLLIFWLSVLAFFTLRLAWIGASLVMVGIYGNFVVGLIQALVIAHALLELLATFVTKYELWPDPVSFQEVIVVSLTFSVAFVLGFVPIVGTLVAAWGATVLLGWARAEAFWIFALPFVAFLSVLLLSHWRFEASQYRDEARPGFAT